MPIRQCPQQALFVVEDPEEPDTANRTCEEHRDKFVDDLFGDDAVSVVIHKLNSNAGFQCEAAVVED